MHLLSLAFGRPGVKRPKGPWNQVPRDVGTLRVHETGLLGPVGGDHRL
jgi:hypothetical protein